MTVRLTDSGTASFCRHCCSEVSKGPTALFSVSNLLVSVRPMLSIDWKEANQWLLSDLGGPKGRQIGLGKKGLDKTYMLQSSLDLLISPQIWLPFTFIA